MNTLTENVTLIHKNQLYIVVIWGRVGELGGNFFEHKQSKEGCIQRVF